MVNAGIEDVRSRLHVKGTFIADQKHGFFESVAFKAVLLAVQAQSRRLKVYEKAGTLRISVQGVKKAIESGFWKTCEQDS